MTINKKLLQKIIKEELNKALLKEAGNQSRVLSNKAREAANQGGWDQKMVTAMLGVLASYVADLQDDVDRLGSEE